MNKAFKIFLAVCGGANVIVSIFIPIAIVLLFISYMKIGSFAATILTVAGGLSSLYRAIDIGWINR